VTDTPSPPGQSEPAATECRNCGAVASRTYCPNCGQETSLKLPTVRALLREAAGRYVTFDGRMWRTLFALLFRPGFLTREYFAGRRRRYIRPARLFLVLSIGLFALLRFEGRAPQIVDSELTAAQRAEIAREANEGGHTGFSLDEDLNIHLDTEGGTRLENLRGTWAEPLRQRADLFNRLPRQEKLDQVFAGVMRYGPYAMFALLPLFAVLVGLVYVGRARRYPARPRRYAAHLVFGAHNHAFLFLMVALFVLAPDGALRAALAAWAIVYLLLSMRKVYGGRWSGVFVRAAIVLLLYLMFFAVVVSGLVIAAIMLR
jgi:hypothetical protein